MPGKNDIEVQVGANDANFNAAMTRMRDASKNLQQKISPLGGALSGVASVTGQMSGKIGAAVPAISGLAATFATGGPLMAGLAAASIGVGIIVNKFVESREQAAAAAKAIEEKYVKALESLRDARRERMKAEKDDIGLLGDELSSLLDKRFDLKLKRDEALRARRGFNLSSEDLEIKKRYRKEFDSADADFKALEIRIGIVRKQLEQAGTNKPRSDAVSRMKLAGEAAAAEEEERQARIDRSDEARKKAEDARRKEEENDKKLADAFETDRLKQLDTVHKMRLALHKEESEYRAQLSKQEEEDKDRAFENDLENERVLREVRLAAIRDEQAARAQAYQEIASGLLDITAFASSIGDQIIRDSITGEEQIIERAGVAVLRYIGQQATAHGSSLILRGAGELALGNVAAGGSIAAGVGLVALGTSLGFGATAIDTNMSSSQSRAATQQGGGSHVPAPTSSIGQGQASSGGGAVYNYYFGGPVFGNRDSAAREVDKLAARGARLNGARKAA